MDVGKDLKGPSKSFSQVSFKDGKSKKHGKLGKNTSTLHLMQIPKGKLEFIDNEKNLMKH